MKVTFEENYKKFYTVEQSEQAKKVIQFEKENDSFTPKDWAQYALNELCHYYGWTTDCVIDAYATTCISNKRTNYFGEDSGMMNVKIYGLGKIFDHGTAYVEFSALLSDVANVGDRDTFNGNMVSYTLFPRA